MHASRRATHHSPAARGAGPASRRTSSAAALGADEEDLLVTRTNIAVCLSELGRDPESLRMKREIYSDTSRILGKDHEDTIVDDPYR